MSSLFKCTEVNESLKIKHVGVRLIGNNAEYWSFKKPFYTMTILMMRKFSLLETIQSGCPH